MLGEGDGGLGRHLCHLRVEQAKCEGLPADLRPLAPLGKAPSEQAPKNEVGLANQSLDDNCPDPQRAKANVVKVNSADQRLIVR